MKKRVVIFTAYNFQDENSDFLHFVNTARVQGWMRRHPGVRKFRVDSMTTATAYFAHLSIKSIFGF